MIGSTLRRVLLLGVLIALTGCQQKMATQPAPRPYEATEINGKVQQSARLLERGVIHRAQNVSGDPMIEHLTEQGKHPKVSEEWKTSVDGTGTGSTEPTAGAPTSVENFVKEYPFEMTKADLERGQRMYNAVCAVCHGGAGYGNGKVPERGYLKPPSYHTDPSGEAKDAGHFVGEALKDLPVGYSRGFDRYAIKVPLKEVPIGYIYQVITWGYGGMGSHNTQLPIVADRWRVVAYVRALQYSQAVPANEVSQATRERIESGKGSEPVGTVTRTTEGGTSTNQSVGAGPGDQVIKDR